MVSPVLPNPSCQHTQTFKTHDGKTKCIACKQIVGEERKCPVCLSKPHGMSANKYYCSNCKTWFRQVEKNECPTCHRTERVLYKHDLTVGGITSEVLYCNACKCEFRRKIHTLTPTPSPSSYDRTDSTTTSTVNVYGSKSVEGICPKCRATVRAYSKRGAWCQKCQAYVYPITKHPTRYVFEGNI